MCLGRRNLSRKARILLALGNICMFTGLALTRFNNGLNQQHSNMIHFFSGFLLGIAIAFLFAAMYKSRSDKQADAPTS